MSQWFCQIAGVESGPFTIDELRFLKARGKLRRDCPVRPATESTWSQATSIPGLFGGRPDAKARHANTVFHAPVPSDVQVEESSGEEDTPAPESHLHDEHEGDAAPMRPPPRTSFQESSPRRRRNLIVLIGGGTLMLFLLMLFLLSWLAGTMSRQLADAGGRADAADQGSTVGSPGSTKSPVASKSKSEKNDSGETPATAVHGDSTEGEAPSIKEQDVVERPANAMSSFAGDGDGTASADDARPIPKAKVIAALPDPGQLSTDRVGGDGRSSRFFGVNSQGRSFVYIVDRSSSMSGSRFDRARTELIEAIRRLKPHQAFYVYFFTTYSIPLDHAAAPIPRLIPASDGNLEEFESWISVMSASGGSSGGPATITEAIKLEPDAIFFLSDGDLPYDTADVIRNQNKRPTIPIHTIGFEDGSGETLLQQVADDSGGTYRFVP